MNVNKIYISGLGIITSLGTGVQATKRALLENKSGISPLQLFKVQQQPLPTAEVSGLTTSSLPRTHDLALAAAFQATQDCSEPPDAVIMGTTTGGILTTEQLLAHQETDSAQYRNHGLSTVTDAVARQCGCTGKVFTVSTACSSGAVAIAAALKMLQSGEIRSVLAGGADSLCLLTYFGFHSLQLVDPEGCRPLDRQRRGMSVGEGAALLLLTTQKPANPIAELLGAGLSCDAYHAAAPHPHGKGAQDAMTKTLQDGGITPDDIDYINLHGTGTPDNDLAESRAVRNLFHTVPALSSIKGATGHSLAASGAIGAVVAAILCKSDFVPANTRLQEVDPDLQLHPLQKPQTQDVSAVLSNSFGFGGNNGCLLVAKPDVFPAPKHCSMELQGLTVLGKSCITGAGMSQASLDLLLNNKDCAGQISLQELSAGLPQKNIRRLKRFSRLGLALAQAAFNDSGSAETPDNVFLGTGWGALSETCDFLQKLRETDEQFPSPIDFVGSVHNSSAGHIAIMFGATGCNITGSNGDYSFEQSLFTAHYMLTKDSPTAFVIGADEGHAEFSPLFDPSIKSGSPLADGGGGFLLTQETVPGKVRILPLFFCSQFSHDTCRIEADWYDLILVGIPAAQKEEGELQLTELLKESKKTPPIVHYRQYTGEFASASAVAAVMAVHLLENNHPLHPLANRRILLLSLGSTLCATAFTLS